MILAPRKREQIIPLPVVLISTVGEDGVRNIAPWSNITPILRPLDDIVLASWIKRDTLNNIRKTREF
ncbi:MAG: flavin reductase family protein, partial [Peptococcaceae bacterium]|nr:flavin reductase family protein [Peptococcaceae bacterium]